MNNINPNIGRIILFNEIKGIIRTRALIGVVIDIDYEFCRIQKKNIIVFKTYEYIESYEMNEEIQKFWKFSSWKHVYDCNFDCDGAVNCNCPGFKFL